MRPGEGIGAGIITWIRRGYASLSVLWRERVWPFIKTWLSAVYGMTRGRVLPVVGTGSKRLKGELAKIHQQQNWMQRCSTTFGGNAAGLGMAMLSTKVMQSLVETRDASNLWGLLAEHPVVSETTYEVLSFTVEYLLGLIIFTITEYYIGEYRRKREESHPGVSAIDDDEAV